MEVFEDFVAAEVFFSGFSGREQAVVGVEVEDFGWEGLKKLLQKSSKSFLFCYFFTP